MFSIHVICEYRSLNFTRQTARILLVPLIGHEIAAVSRQNTEIGSLIATGHHLNLEQWSCIKTQERGLQRPGH